MPAPKTSAPSAKLPGRSPAAASDVILQAEDALDLTERPRREHHGDRDDDGDDEPEANPRPALLAMPPCFAARRARWCR